MYIPFYLLYPNSKINKNFRHYCGTYGFGWGGGGPSELLHATLGLGVDCGQEDMMATPDSDILVIEPSRDLVFRGELMYIMGEERKFYYHESSLVHFKFELRLY